MRGLAMSGGCSFAHTAILPGERKINDREQEEPADDCHVLQAGRQFAPELRSVAEPKPMSDQSSRSRKAGEQQRAQPCEEVRGHENSADELSKYGGTRESRRPRQSVAPNLLDARTPVPQLVDAAIEKHRRETQPSDRERISDHGFSFLSAAIRCLTVGSPSA